MPLAVALGDPAGIGPEIVAKSWERRDALAVEWPRHPRDAAEQLAVEQEILAERLGCAEAVPRDDVAERRQGLHAWAMRRAQSAAVFSAATIAPGSAWSRPAMAKAVP